MPQHYLYGTKRDKKYFHKTEIEAATGVAAGIPKGVWGQFTPTITSKGDSEKPVKSGHPPVGMILKRGGLLAIL